MPTILSIQNKLLSVRGNISISNENGELLYDAKGEFALVCPTWRVTKNGEQIAIIRRRFWAWSRTWTISSSMGSFTVKRKRFAWRRTYNTIGGPYNGAVIKGNLFDLKFHITHLNRPVAAAKGKLLSFRDTHGIVVTDTRDTAELFTALTMVVLLLDRRSESSGNDD